MEDFILKDFDSEVKSVEGERALTVTISTNDVDRSGDIVEPKGAKLTNFKKNPVVLMAHDYHGLPIGKASEITKTDNGITAKVTFPEEGVYPLADTVYNMYDKKFMKGWSIGFIPIKSEDIVDDDENKSWLGRRFKTWELLEFSACSVPNNPFALNNMVSKGIDIEPLKEAGLFVMPDDPEEIKEVKTLIVENLEGLEPDPIDPEKLKAGMEKDDLGDEKLEGMIEELKFYPEIKYIVVEDKSGVEIGDEEWETFKEMAEQYCEKYLACKKELEELKEKLADLELKAGAVLNVKNKSNLKDAQELIQTVLDSAGSEESLEEGEDETKDTKKDDAVITIIDTKKEDPPKDEVKDEKKITIDPKILETAITKSINYALGIVDK